MFHEKNQKYGCEAQFDSGEYAFESTKIDAGRKRVYFYLCSDLLKSMKTYNDFPSKWIIKSQQTAACFKLGPTYSQHGASTT